MRRIDEVIKEIKTTDTHAQIDKDIWVPARPLLFSYGILTGGYWCHKGRRLKDAWQVLTGYAEAVDWGQGKKH